ncbi:uncharacterized protein TRAVEDRAFT_72110 [Trametes versicolor FP-101664 SS1]|uniref:uncharacterized protein n=1 Tax=Trametes versicolor (strain FP-101664) TaxID=717944 RepID=UPI0004623408|nr:uncharacterized protein TRAVEDRAFT_72110 [Trametes versicolor FP-101664 SS1]EIW58591.1 hypothetical protein TRAVEDRAFT_72110 [Trametes versicolor FP-101664 SS1]
MQRLSSETVSLLDTLLCVGAAPTFSTAGVIYPKAAHPFDSPDADVVFRSSDKVDFRVHSIILSIASPIFAGVRFPKSTQSNSAEQPWTPLAIEVQEHSTTLDCLFRLCYPVTDPTFDDLKSVRVVYEAAKKYRMSEAVSLMRTTLQSFIPQAPLRVWAISCILELEKEAHAAADHLLKFKFPSAAIAEYHEVYAGAYFRLRRYLNKGVADANYTFCALDPDEAAALPALGSLYLSESDIGIFSDYADVTCRARDGADFAAHKVVLAMSSTLLADMIKGADRRFEKSPSSADRRSSSGSSHTTPVDRPVLRFSCTGPVLKKLLSLCYNPTSSWLRKISVAGLVSLMVYAREYRMDRVLDIVSKEFREASASLALPCYLLATNHLFDKEKAMAEFWICEDPLRHGYVREMESVKAWAYHELVEKHRALKHSKVSEVATRKAPRKGTNAAPALTSSNH